MTTKNELPHKSAECSVELTSANSSEVDAGADMTLQGKLSCSPAADLRGNTLLIKDQDGATVESIELSEFDGVTNQTSEFVVKVPLIPAAYTWTVVCPMQETAGVSPQEVSANFSFTVKPHSIDVVVWEVPPTIECGKSFRLQLGARCAWECRPDDWVLEVSDQDGEKLARTSLSDDPWPDTTALYHGSVELIAPDKPGLYAWEARAPASGQDCSDSDRLHSESVASFGVRVVPAPECVLTVEAVDMESQTPIEGAKIVVHPYRAFTDERGLAQVRVPKGEYRLFVSGKKYFPFRSDIEVKTDITIRAELAVDREISEADVWS
jgi:hypothetical protein